MDEYVCLTVLAQAGETEAAFKSRLYAFWTHMLRNRPGDYEKVYAEAVEFEREGGRVARRYMVQPDAVAVLLAELTEHQIDHLPVDLDDTYTKAEASTNEWFQLEH